MTTPLGPTRGLGSRLTQSLRDRILHGEWARGAKLPSEAEIGDEYAVSRTTVRAALRSLESEGFTRTRHGSGTYVSPIAGAITAPLQSLRSLTDTIREQGHTPSMRYDKVELRTAKADEIEALELDEGAQVLAMTRVVESDSQPVAYSFDTIPSQLLPTDFETSEVKGSTFKLLRDRASLVAVQSIATISARPTIPGLETNDGIASPLLLLEQCHFTELGKPIMSSRTYFVEDRFQFTVLRTAPN